MSQFRSNITFRMDTAMKDKLKEFSHSIGLELPELIEIICNFATYDIEKNEETRKFIKHIAEETRLK